MSVVDTNTPDGAESSTFSERTMGFGCVFLLILERSANHLPQVAFSRCFDLAKALSGQRILAPESRTPRDSEKGVEQAGGHSVVPQRLLKDRKIDPTDGIRRISRASSPRFLMEVYQLF